MRGADRRITNHHIRVGGALNGHNIVAHQSGDGRFVHHLGIFGLKVKEARLMRCRMAISAGFTDHERCKTVLQRVERGCANTSRCRQSSDNKGVDPQFIQLLGQVSSEKGGGILLADDRLSICWLNGCREIAKWRAFVENL